MLGAFVRRSACWGYSVANPKRYLMAAQGSGGKKEEETWRDCLGQSDATELDNALFFDYEYSIDQLMEIAGLCVAQVSNQCYIGLCMILSLTEALFPGLPLLKGFMVLLNWQA